jgi:hypothetical protein
MSSSGARLTKAETQPPVAPMSRSSLPSLTGANCGQRHNPHDDVVQHSPERLFIRAQRA